MQNVILRMKCQSLILPATQLPHYPLVGIVVATDLKLSPRPLACDALIARGGPEVHLSLDSSGRSYHENSISLKMKSSRMHV